jgi:hypothetical protein
VGIFGWVYTNGEWRNGTLGLRVANEAGIIGEETWKRMFPGLELPPEARKVLYEKEQAAPKSSQEQRKLLVQQQALYKEVLEAMSSEWKKLFEDLKGGKS